MCKNIAKSEHLNMNNQTRDNLIAVIRENIRDKANLTTYLSDILNIGRESAYRRIRGEINFTFEEIIILSQDLGFSVDNIIGAKKDENALFNIHMLSQNMGYFDIYVKKMTEYGHLFQKARNVPDAKARMSINTLPYFFHISYKALSRFRIYKWLYQNRKITSYDKFSDFELPEKVWDAHKFLYESIQAVPNVLVVMDHNIIRTVVREIEYFQKRSLLSNDDLQLLKGELNDIVNALEKMAIEGKCKHDANLELYVSEVDLEASYLHFECSGNQFAQVRIYSISAIDSFNEGLCRIQKNWIESLKRYSVLISGSGEMQRFDFLKEQRRYINKITSFMI